MDIADIMDIVGIVDIVDIGECAEYTRPLRRIHPCAALLQTLCSKWLIEFSPNTLAHFAEYTRPPNTLESGPNTLEWALNLRKCSAE